MSRRVDIPDLIVVGIVILLAIVLSPIWAPVFAYVYLNQKITAWRFRAYIKENHGKTFFCYTHRQNSATFVREQILPSLPPNVEVIYITEWFDSLQGNSRFARQIIFEMVETKQGFPCLAKFENGGLVIESVNHELYQTIVRNRETDRLIQRIIRFYSD